MFQIRQQLLNQLHGLQKLYSQPYNDSNRKIIFFYTEEECTHTHLLVKQSNKSDRHDP